MLALFSPETLQARAVKGVNSVIFLLLMTFDQYYFSSSPAPTKIEMLCFVCVQATPSSHQALKLNTGKERDGILQGS